MIDIVLDNLNTRLADVLIEIFGKAEADRMLKRLTFHYTSLFAIEYGRDRIGCHETPMPSTTAARRTDLSNRIDGMGTTEQ